MKIVKSEKLGLDWKEFFAVQPNVEIVYDDILNVKCVAITFQQEHVFEINSIALFELFPGISSTLYLENH